MPKKKTPVRKKTSARKKTPARRTARAKARTAKPQPKPKKKARARTQLGTQLKIFCNADTNEFQDESGKKSTEFTIPTSSGPGSVYFVMPSSSTWDRVKVTITGIEGSDPKKLFTSEEVEFEVVPVGTNLPRTTNLHGKYQIDGVRFPKNGGGPVEGMSGTIKVNPGA